MSVNRERSTLHHSAVITTAHVYYGDGTVTPLAPAGTPLILRPADVLAGIRGRFTTPAVVVIDAPVLGAAAAWAAAAAELREAGWYHGEPDAWTTYRHTDGRVVIVGHRAMMRKPHLGVLFTADTDSAVLALLLDRYFRTVGHPWRGTPATSALAAIRSSWENAAKKPLWKTTRTGPGTGVGPLIWSRPLNQWERSWGKVHTFDANWAYLGAAINAECAWSALVHTGPQTFDAKLPGYWLLSLDTATLARLRQPEIPPVVGRVRDGCVWVTTPMARFLGEELGDRCEVLDSYTGQELVQDGRRIHGPSSRALRTWGEGMRDALTTLDGRPAGALKDTLTLAAKRTYKDATGGMQRASMRVARPDWAHTLIDGWRATLLRTIERVHRTQGVWPVAIRTDSVSYADGDNWHTLAAAIGAPTKKEPPRLGRWKYMGAVGVSEFEQKQKGRR